MRVYLDLCAIQRPNDDLSQLRIRHEADAVLAVIRFCDAGGADLVSSEALRHEAAGASEPERHAQTNLVLSRAASFVTLTSATAQDAVRRIGNGFDALDALHLACAAAAGAEYFITCDDRLLKRAKISHTPPPNVLSPVAFCSEHRL